MALDDPRSVYVPPTGDAPLDEIEHALVRFFVRVIVREIQEAGSAEAWSASLQHTDEDETGS